jgi:hypothetical protein
MMADIRLSKCDGRSEINREGFTLPWCEFQPVAGKIFRQRTFKALTSCFDLDLVEAPSRGQQGIEVKKIPDTMNLHYLCH